MDRKAEYDNALGVSRHHQQIEIVRGNSRCHHPHSKTTEWKKKSCKQNQIKKGMFKAVDNTL